MNSKMTTKSQLSTTEPKNNKNKNKLRKQLELEQNEETRIQKNEERLRNLGDDIKCSNMNYGGAIRRRTRARN